MRSRLLVRRTWANALLRFIVLPPFPTPTPPPQHPPPRRPPTPPWAPPATPAMSLGSADAADVTEFLLRPAALEEWLRAGPAAAQGSPGPPSAWNREDSFSGKILQVF